MTVSSHHIANRPMTRRKTPNPYMLYVRNADRCGSSESGLSVHCHRKNWKEIIIGNDTHNTNATISWVQRKKTNQAIKQTQNKDTQASVWKSVRHLYGSKCNEILSQEFVLNIEWLYQDLKHHRDLVFCCLCFWKGNLFIKHPHYTSKQVFSP